LALKTFNHAKLDVMCTWRFNQGHSQFVDDMVYIAVVLVWKFAERYAEILTDFVQLLFVIAESTIKNVYQRCLHWIIFLWLAVLAKSNFHILQHCSSGFDFESIDNKLNLFEFKFGSTFRKTRCISSLFPWRKVKAGLRSMVAVYFVEEKLQKCSWFVTAQYNFFKLSLKTFASVSGDGLGYFFNTCRKAPLLFVMHALGGVE